MCSSALAYLTPVCLFLAVSLILKRGPSSACSHPLFFFFPRKYYWSLSGLNQVQGRGVVQDILMKTVGLHRVHRCLPRMANIPLLWGQKGRATGNKDRFLDICTEQPPELAWAQGQMSYLSKWRWLQLELLKTNHSRFYPFPKMFTSK